MDLSLHFLVPADVRLLPRVEAAVAGGVTVVQLREKAADDRRRLAVGRELRALCRRLGAAFAVDDRPDLALLLEADIVHVGQDDLPPAWVRRLVGQSMAVGLSTHNLDQVQAAAAEEVDYIAFGPVFDTRSKEGADPPTGLAALQAAVQAAGRPVVAIGGIDVPNKDAVLATGAAGIAVISALLDADDVLATARALRKRDARSQPAE